MTKSEDRVICRTPTEGRPGVTSIPRWKYDCVRAAILEAVQSAGSEGFAFSGLKEAVRERLSDDALSSLGSLGWHVTTVKLNMEVDCDIQRLPGSPQRLVIST